MFNFFDVEVVRNGFVNNDVGFDYIVVNCRSRFSDFNIFGVGFGLCCLERLGFVVFVSCMNVIWVWIGSEISSCKGCEKLRGVYCDLN